MPACTVTSSAVVGSSAISSSGSPLVAIAIIARWSWPPDSWCGYDAAIRAGSSSPTEASSSTRATSTRRREYGRAPRRPPRSGGRPCGRGSRRPSAPGTPCRPGRRAPRGARSRSRPSRSSPSSSTCSADAHLRAGGAGARTCAVTVLPEPDSPTSATTRPRSTSRSIPCTTSRAVRSTAAAPTTDPGRRWLEPADREQWTVGQHAVTRLAQRDPQVVRVGREARDVEVLDVRHRAGTRCGCRAAGRRARPA